MVSDMVAMAATATTIGAVTIATTTTATAIGGDEFHSLGINPHDFRLLTCWSTPTKGLGATPGPLSFILPILLIL